MHKFHTNYQAEEMRAAFRTASIPAFVSSSTSHFSPHPPLPCPNPNPIPFSPLLLLLLRTPSSSLRCFSSTPPPPPPPLAPSSTSDSFFSSPSPFMEKQFEEFRLQLAESGSVRERIRSVVMEMEEAARIMHASLLLVHQAVPSPEILEKAKAQIEVIKGLFGRLAEILKECPGQYYRFHGDWRSETQMVVSLLAFMHWLETGVLMMHAEAEMKLGLDSSDFGLDIEDYLTGLCFMSNELPRYVVNQVTAGNYDCPRKVLRFLTDLHAAFRMLNLRNDFLRKKFDGMKYDLRRVEEVYYDVKIRGLATADSTKDEATQA